MAITWTDVVNIASELASVPVGTQNAILADVAIEVDPDVWGTRYDIACKYLAAHLATVYRRKGTGGLVTHESVGGVSRSYSTKQVVMGGTETTAYGDEFDRLALTLPAARVSVA